jgi:D-tyrosyl-tRNA(Tyr) deacylase
LLQRVTQAQVAVGGQPCGAIGRGLLALVGVTAGDDGTDIDWLVRKILALRVFDDDAGVMNRALVDVGGDLLAVSQFTLYASTRGGNRPSYSAAAPPLLAEPLFQRFVGEAQRQLGKPVPTGRFGANMEVVLTNDGPVTIMLDSRARE